MKYFVAKIKYSEPIPGKDGLKKISKNFLVRAETVTEVETLVQGWWPANWLDPEVKSVTPSAIQDIIKETESETWWQVKLMFENGETGKLEPYNSAYNGGTIEIILPRVKKANPMAEIFEIKRLKIELDEDLLK